MTGNRKIAIRPISPQFLVNLLQALRRFKKATLCDEAAEKLSCTCPDCRELQAFSLNPLERIHRFRVKKERRQHLHNTIDRHRLDMTHITERVGSPQTLVCTKDRRTFDRRMKEYKAEVGAMCSLLRMLPKADGAVALGGRMKAAANSAASKISVNRLGS